LKRRLSIFRALIFDFSVDAGTPSRATAPERRVGNQRAAGRHRSVSRATILALADSLVDHERLRATFLAAPPVPATIDPGAGTRDVSPELSA
jgi:hypothetical protein